MAITLGTYSFDPVNTAFQESYEELGGRDARTIRLAGLLSDTTIEALEAELDRILATSTPDAAVVALTLRPSRQLWVRRLSFTRELQRESCTASFKLELEAPDGWEESVDQHNELWTVTGSGESHAVSVGGNRWTPLKVSITATDTLLDPGVSDGLRQMQYPGVMTGGQTLIFDGVENRVTLDGVEVTSLCTGIFPRLYPGTAGLVFNDAEDSAHTAILAATWRERWW